MRLRNRELRLGLGDSGGCPVLGKRALAVLTLPCEVLMPPGCVRAVPVRPGDLELIRGHDQNSSGLRASLGTALRPGASTCRYGWLWAEPRNGIGAMVRPTLLPGLAVIRYAHPSAQPSTSITLGWPSEWRSGPS